MDKKLSYLTATALVCLLSILPATLSLAQSSAPSARKSPDWLKTSVVYEIFPRNFSQEGALNSITARLDELKDLGVDILWLMPIQPSGEKNKKGSLGSPFAVRDFYGIAQEYGTTGDFKQLVDQAHQRGMKVIMGMGVGQTSWDSVLMEHPDYYRKDTNGAIIPPDPAYADVAALNFDNPAVRRYMIDMLAHWLKDFGVDGFRCDVSPTVPVDFWETARAELEKINPQLIILADAGAKPQLLAKAFDVDSSWNLFRTLDYAMKNVEPTANIETSWKLTDQQFPKGSLHLRFTDNHEQARAVVRYGIDGALAAQVLMLTLDGVPMFYNGMEVGDATESADPALFEKMPIFWHPSGRPPLREIYRQLIKLRKDCPAFTNGDVDWLQNSASDEVVSFRRKDAKDEFLVLINFSNHRADGTVEAGDSSGLQPLKISNRSVPVSSLPAFSLGAFDWAVYHRAVAK